MPAPYVRTLTPNYSPRCRFRHPLLHQLHDVYVVVNRELYTQFSTSEYVRRVSLLSCFQIAPDFNQLLSRASTANINNRTSIAPRDKDGRDPTTAVVERDEDGREKETGVANQINGGTSEMDGKRVDRLYV